MTFKRPLSSSKVRPMSPRVEGLPTSIRHCPLAQSTLVRGTNEFQRAPVHRNFNAILQLMPAVQWRNAPLQRMHEYQRIFSACSTQRIPRTHEFQRIPAHARISAQSSARPNFSAFRRTPEFQRIPAHAGISAHSSAPPNFSAFQRTPEFQRIPANAGIAFQRIAMHSTNAKPRSHGARIHCKLLVSPLRPPIILPYMTPFEEFRP